MRLLLAMFGLLTLLAVVVLYLRPGDTDRYFAWTILPPLTAAFLGAGYAAGCVLVLLSLRAGDWAGTRGPIATIWVFALLTLVATLLHLDPFHLDSARALPRFAAWFWLAVYVTVPVVMLALFAVQERRFDATLGRGVAMPRWLAGVLLAQGALMLVIGVLLYAVPGSAGTLWPWQLSDLTARAVAAWLVAFAVAAFLAVKDGDLARLSIPALAYGLFGALELLALLRYRDEPRWDEPVAWCYAAAAAVVTATGAAGWVLARRAHPGTEFAGGRPAEHSTGG